MLKNHGGRRGARRSVGVGQTRESTSASPCQKRPKDAESNLHHAKIHPPSDPQHQNKEITVPEGLCHHCMRLTLPGAAPGMQSLGGTTATGSPRAPTIKPVASGAAPRSCLPRAEHRSRRQFAKQRFPIAPKSETTFCCTLIRGLSFALLPSGGCRYFNFAKRGLFHSKIC